MFVFSKSKLQPPLTFFNSKFTNFLKFSGEWSAQIIIVHLFCFSFFALCNETLFWRRLNIFFSSLVSLIDKSTGYERPSKVNIKIQQLLLRWNFQHFMFFAGSIHWDIKWNLHNFQVEIKFSPFLPFVRKLQRMEP